MRIIRGRGKKIICGCGLSADVNLADADNPRMQISKISTPLHCMQFLKHDAGNEYNEGVCQFQYCPVVSLTFNVFCCHASFSSKY